jgi:hypothetical protein
LDESERPIDESDEIPATKPISPWLQRVRARVFVLVVAVLVGGNLHVGSARAAGVPYRPTSSAQVDGIVSSALGAAQQEPAQAQETANTIVDQA